MLSVVEGRRELLGEGVHVDGNEDENGGEKEAEKERVAKVGGTITREKEQNAKESDGEKPSEEEAREEPTGGSENGIEAKNDEHDEVRAHGKQGDDNREFIREVEDVKEEGQRDGQDERDHGQALDDGDDGIPRA